MSTRCLRHFHRPCITSSISLCTTLRTTLPTTLSTTLSTTVSTTLPTTVHHVVKLPVRQSLAGWFNDIFTAKLEIDGSPATTISGASKSVDADKDLSGRLIVAPPDGRTVRHEGVQLVLKSVATLTLAVESVQAKVMEKTFLLRPPGDVSETIEIPFSLDLAAILELRESYSSETLSLVHTLGYKIHRPWWTFSISADERIDIRRHSADEPPPLANASDPILRVEDFGGECTFAHGAAVFDVDGSIEGQVEFDHMDEAAAIGQVAVLLGRTETCGALTFDEVVRTLWVHRGNVAIVTSCTLPVSLPLKASTAGGLQGDLQPSLPVLIPSDPGCSANDTLEVRYWLRLELTEAANAASESLSLRKWWNTHPVILRRRNQSGVIPDV
ncbi:hypothetical protein AB1Y20_015874 [Prymnesium parvum]|uniref:Arrestin-like N-terminal domain-containing protein n=1 Tax=Prymnesium parvum TaxID=97485 RepID=A0AB34JZS4_PRYPA